MNGLENRSFRPAKPYLSGSFPRREAPAWTGPAFIILAILAGCMALLLCAGTVYGLLRNPRSGPLFSLGVPEAALPAPESAVRGRTPSEAWGMDAEGRYQDGVFTGIGRLRISLEPQPAAAVLSVVFPYTAEDRAFFEELAARLPELRQITGDYFKGFSADELRRADEASLKSGILARYNQLLRLGKIEAIYFNDFVILD